MSRVEELEREIAQLDDSELRAFREWFAQYDADDWDRQLESDASGGKLDGMAESALQEHGASRSTVL